MRILLLFLLSLLLHNTAFAQPTKLRAFGIGLSGELGYTYPTDSNEGMQSIFTLYGRDISNTWAGRYFTPSDRFVKSHSYGASLFYTASTRKFNLITVEGGMKQTKLVYYYSLDFPIKFLTEETTYFHDWFYLNQGFLDLVLSLHLDRKKSLFLYTKLGGTYSWVGENVNPFIELEQDGIYESGTQLSTSVFNQETLIIDEVSKEAQFGLLGGLGLHINLGEARQHTFFGGVNFHYSLGQFIESSYTWKDDVATIINTSKKYEGSYFMYEFGYRIPLVRYRDRSNGAKMQQISKTPRAPKSNKTKNGKISYLTIDIKPSTMVAAWRVPGGQWNSPSSAVPLIAGLYDIQFKTISGYSAPSRMQVAVTRGKNRYTATYTKNRPIAAPKTPASGRISVIIAPFGANASGAEWRIAGGAWQKSNETVRGLTAGNYQLEYKTVKGYASPSGRSVYISSGKLESVNGVYTEISSDSPETKILKEQMKACFKEEKEQAKYYENDLKIKGNTAKIEFFADDNDGDLISICLDGKLLEDKTEILDEGKKISIDLNGKTEAILIIYAHNTGNDKTNNIGIQVIEGSVAGEGAKGQEVKIQLEKKEYYWIKIMK